MPMLGAAKLQIATRSTTCLRAASLSEASLRQEIHNSPFASSSNFCGLLFGSFDLHQTVYCRVQNLQFVERHLAKIPKNTS